MEASEPAITLEDVRNAAARLEPWARRTPVMTSRTLDSACGGSIFLKCENLQRMGAFKFRGAMNALLQLDAAACRAGVVTHSSGNHAQALALAGQLLGIPVCVVMPRTAPAVKKAATLGYGAEIVECEPTLADRERTVNALITERGRVLVHPFDDWRVIAGQGTVALELLEQAGPLDLVVTPIGGGGLAAGTAIAVKGASPQTRVIGAEPAAADDALRSLRSGKIQPSNDPKTIADGLRTTLGTRPFSVIRRMIDDIVTSTDTETLAAMRFLMERLKIVVEPSSAVAVAPVLTKALPVRNLRVGIILSGGNVDLSPLFQALEARC